MRLRYLLFALLILWDAAFAANSEGIFHIACDTDLSAKFLTNIFGSELVSNICAAPGSVSSLGRIFQVFNMGLVVFAGGFISYAAVSSAIGKASDGGQAAGKSNPWVPLRLATGTSLLVPLKSGYSFIQLIVMWSVLQGVGLANSIWSKQLELLGSPQTIEPQQSVQSTYGHIFNGLSMLDSNNLTLGKKDDRLKVTNMFAVGTCLAVLQKANTAAQALSTSIPNINYTVSDICYSDDNQRYDDSYMCAGGNLINRNVCGVFKFDDETKNLSPAKSLAMSQLKLQIKNSILEAKAKATEVLDGMIYTDQYAIAQTEDCQSSSSVCTTLKLMYNNIDKEALRLVKNEENNKTTVLTTDKQAWTDPAKLQGWITAGQYYYKFSAQETDEVLEFNFAESQKYLPRIVKAFNIPGMSSSDNTNTLNNAYTKKKFSIGTPEETFDYLLKKFRLVIDKNLVKKSFDKQKTIGFSEDIVSNTDNNHQSNPIEKGALLLKNKIYASLLKPATDLDSVLEGSVFRLTSMIDFITPGADIRLSAPLDNLIVLLTLSAGEITGLDLRKNTWVTVRTDQTTIHSENNLGSCWASKNPENNFLEKCIRDNAGIVGYLYSYYKKASIEDENNKLKATATIDPLTNLSNIGINIMRYAVDYWVNTLSAIYSISQDLMIRYSIAKITTALVSGLASAIPYAGTVVSTIGSVLISILDVLYSIDTYNLSLFMPLGLAISSVIFLMGVMLGMYLPFLPFMIYTFTAIGWIIAVIEAMIAAPLVALGVTHPQGHDLLGKSEQAIILLLGIFIRPSAILLGFIASIYLLKEVLMLVNTGFLTLIPSTLSVSDGLNVNQFIANNIMIFGVLMVYIYIIMAVVNQVFSIIFQVPEKILRWIGAAPEHSGISQMVGEVKQGAQSGGQTLAQGGQQMGSQKADMKTVDSGDVEDSAKAAGKQMKPKGKSEKTGEGKTGT